MVKATHYARHPYIVSWFKSWSPTLTFASMLIAIIIANRLIYLLNTDPSKACMCFGLSFTGSYMYYPSIGWVTACACFARMSIKEISLEVVT